MKKSILIYAAFIVVFMTFLSFKSNDTVQKCVKIKCGKKGYYELMTGTDETDIANQIKTKYNNCSFEYVDKKKCKNL